MAPKGLTVRGLSLSREQGELQRQYDAEYAAFEAGAYTERVQDWLATSWQGDALQVGSYRLPCTARAGAHAYISSVQPRAVC